MSCNWPTVTVEDIASESPNALATGPFGSAISSKFFTDNGVPVIRGSNLSTDTGVRLKDEGIVFVSEEKAKEFSRSVARVGDLVFTCWGTINQVGYIDGTSNWDEYIISNKQMKLTVDTTKVDPRFLYYVFSSPLKQREILSNGIGAAVPGFNLGQLRKHTFQLPPLIIQSAISDILELLDKKANKNAQINQTLEEMAQAIFKSWFVDFDPVKAKMNGEQPEGMDAATASLFPEKLVESEMGLIPAGWDIATIKDFGSVVCGKTPSKKNADFYGGDVPFIKIPDTHGKVFITETTDTLTQAGDESQPKKRIPENSVCVSCIATVGQVFITTKPSHTNQQINSVVPHDANSLYYLLFKFKGLNKHFHDLASGGSATLNMNTRTFSNVELVRPTPDVMEAFHQTIGGLMQKILVNQLENATLAELRDTLLPKLLSGEIEL
ncbi:TPA: restriction endonuclease subunit S [Vibrio parahaemolyticus]|jgi:type I restriction enzyme S subunit|nr:restriction endonuclease subunit S [Vibrio alginolyticus]HCE1550753.1 restriction endonuclease subunit S [Vibrio parahaemolyticus]HCH1026989.1 restriction endonuclease subunit S [Vibrio parahaemolyticus]